MLFLWLKVFWGISNRFDIYVSDLVQLHTAQETWSNNQDFFYQYK